MLNDKIPNNKNFLCTVCGYGGLTEPPVDKFGCSTYSICPCCGTEFGYDDSSRSHEELRQAWIVAGAKWFSRETLQPTEWTAAAQLRAAGFE